MKKILITGGAGYVGAMLTPHFLKKGYHVTVLDLMIFGEDVLTKHENLIIARGDIRDKKILEKHLFEKDIVIHLACISNDPSYEMDPQLGKSINFDSFRPLVEISKKNKVQRFIYASSSSVYGVKEERDEDCALLIKNLIADQLQMTEEIAFDRVHRIGQPKPGSNRPIVAKFHYYTQRENVRTIAINKSQDLRSAGYGISIQQTKAVLQKRREMGDIYSRENAEQLTISDNVFANRQVVAHSRSELVEIDFPTAIRVNSGKKCSESMSSYSSSCRCPEATPDLVQPHCDVARSAKPVDIFSPADPQHTQVVSVSM